MLFLLDPEARAVVAHRGDSTHAPENTIESLRRGAALGADALECDVRVSRDGYVVVIHDPTVERTTNGEGEVGQLTLAELQRLDAGYRFTRDGGRTFPWRGCGTTIPTLEALLEAVPAIPLIVEVKTPAAAAGTMRVLERCGATARCLIGSFLARALAPFRRAGIAHCASRRDVIRLLLRAILPGGPRTLPFQALCIPPVSHGIALPVARFARMAAAAGVPTHLWTVDDPDRARRYWERGVNSIITNDPATILAAAGRAPASTLPSPV